MTLDDAIKHAEEVAEEQEKAAKEWHENQVRKCELILFAEMDYTHENECKKCADEHRQLAEWLKEFKRLLEQQSSEDCVSREQAIKTISTDIQLNLEGRSGLLKYSDEIKDIIKTLLDSQKKKLKALPPVTPTHGTCKDCKQLDVMDCGYYCKLNHWSKISTEGNCGGMGDFYCADYEKRGDENESK